MERTTSHSFTALTRDILFLPLKHKIHIFSSPCNILNTHARHVLCWSNYLWPPSGPFQAVGGGGGFRTNPPNPQPTGLPLCETSINGRGCEEIVFQHLEQLASPNLDSDSQESVFDRVETLYNTVVSVRWGNIILLWLNDRHN